MDSGQNRCLDQAAIAQRHEVIVAVNQVELGGVLEDLCDVKVFGHLGIGSGVFFISFVNDGVEPGAGDRVLGGKQSHVPAARHQSFGNITRHGLPCTVSPRGGSPSYW